MIQRILFSILFFAASTLSILAQPVLEFEESSFDFGEVVEGTKATHEFTFKNTGNEPLVLQNVRASCGCTTPSWTKDPVLPGQKGKITAVYNSQGRPGVFNKSITVTSNAVKPSLVVSIKGQVLRESEVKKYTEEEIAQSPVLKPKKSEINLGKVEKGQAVPFSIEVNNDGKSGLTLSGFKSSCNCFTLDKTELVVAPGKKGTFKGIYNPKTVGETAEKVSLVSNDISQAPISIIIKANVVESLNSKSVLKEGVGQSQF